jgi:hypothetical protein
VVVLCGVLLDSATAFGMVALPYPVGKQLRGQRRTMTSYGLEVSTFQVIVGHEEVFDLIQVLWPQIVEGLDRRSVDSTGFQSIYFNIIGDRIT